MKKFFLYIEPLWTGRDGKISFRSVAAIMLTIDFVINVHNCSSVLVKAFHLIMSDKPVDSTLVASLATYLAQMVLLLGIEAGLIAALLALKTYQPLSLQTPSGPGYYNATTESKTTVSQQPAEQVV